MSQIDIKEKTERDIKVSSKFATRKRKLFNSLNSSDFVFLFIQLFD
jgi:tetrahydromethanopterin S-methyltransferase subunit F